MYTVLICDDKEVFRRKVKRLPYFQPGNHKFQIQYEACNGLEALEILSRQHVDVVLTDIRMPFVDGLELLKRIKAEQLCRCVILFSEFAEFVYARAGIINGAFDYIVKPLDNEKVAATMDRAYDFLLELVSAAVLDSPLIETIADMILKNAGTSAMSYASRFVDRLLLQSSNRLEITLAMNNALEQLAQLIIKNRPWIIRFVPILDLCRLNAGYDGGRQLKELFLHKIEVLLHEVNKFVVKSKKRLVQNVCQYVLDHVETECGLQMVADTFYVNKKYLSAMMKRELGIGFVEYMTYIKVERAKVMLLNADVKIGEVASALHFSDADYFSKIFKKVTTYTPSAYKRMFGL